MILTARRSALVAALALTCATFGTVPARADGIENVYERTIVPGANEAIKDVLDADAKARETTRRQASLPLVAPSESPISGTVAQVPPVSQQRVGPTIGLPTGIGFTADVSSAYPYGDIGSYGKRWLMGGFDASLSYAFDPTTRVVGSVFQLQHWPYGFNSGQVPVYLAGFRNPVGCADLSGGNACGPGAGENINVATKDTFGIFMLEKLFLIKGMPGGHVLPIVISPTYVTRGGQIAESTDNNDIVPFAYNPPDGPVFTNLATRTAQYKAVAVTLPFLKTPKMFGTFTVAPSWLMHTAGVNSGNSMQVAQVLYLEYTPFENTKLFFEPQSARDYLPTDPYPEHLVAYFLGVSRRITKYGFVQVVLNSGNPTNLGPPGAQAIKCVTTAICAPALGGLKATQVQVQIGIGSPNYFPL